MSGIDHAAERRLRSFLEDGAVLAADTTAVRLLIGEGDQFGHRSPVPWLVLAMLQRGALEFSSRALSVRERERASAVLAFAARRLESNVQGGQSVREDGFFAPDAGLRSAADEVTEGILFIAAREHEESKLPYLGTLLANIACHGGTDRTQSALLTRLAGDLSYRQFGLLAVFAYGDRFGLRSSDYTTERRISFATVAVLQEVNELERRSLLLQTNGAVLGIRDLIPSGLVPVGVGEALIKRLGLNRMAGEELEPIAALLR
jgi:hypothetical protein